MKATRKELLEVLGRLASLADSRVNGDDKEEMCVWAEALYDAEILLQKEPR